MKFLKFISPIFLLVCMNVQAEVVDEFDIGGCENVRAGVINEFKIDANHVAQVVCDNTMLLNLVKNGKKVFSINTKESCKDNASFDANFFGRKAIYTSLSPCTGVSPTSSESIYIVDTATRTIVYAGYIPIAAFRQDDGTFLYEALTPYDVIREIYSFTGDNKIIIKKSTVLIYDSNVCIRTTGEIRSYISDEDKDCESIIIANRNNPVCVERHHGAPSKIISLDKCDIKRDKLPNLREDE